MSSLAAAPTFAETRRVNAARNAARLAAESALSYEEWASGAHAGAIDAAAREAGEKALAAIRRERAAALGPDELAWFDGFRVGRAGGSGLPDGITSDDEYAAFRQGWTEGRQAREANR